MRRFTVLVVVTAICLLASCGSEKDDSPAASGTSASAKASADAEATDPCETLSLSAVGEILGGPVTLKEVPGGGCGFNSDDPREPSLGVFAVDGAGGGYEASKAGNVVDGDVEDVPGVGDGAWVAVGTSGGDSIHGQGVAAFGDQLVNITLLQSTGLDESSVREMMLDLLALVSADG